VVKGLKLPPHLAAHVERRADHLGMSEPPRLRIEGYVIVSADGMLADAARAMPAELKFPADQAFFAAALDAAASHRPRPQTRSRTSRARRSAGASW